MFLTLQEVSGHCALLCFIPADNAFPWFSSWSVITVSYYFLSLLLMPVFGSLVCERLQCLAESQACWWCPSLVLQGVKIVSSSTVSLLSKPADDTFLYSTECKCLWCLTVIPSLLTISSLGPLVCVWLQCLAMFQAYYNTCPSLFRK